MTPAAGVGLPAWPNAAAVSSGHQIARRYKSLCWGVDSLWPDRPSRVTFTVAEFGGKDGQLLAPKRQNATSSMWNSAGRQHLPRIGNGSAPAPPYRRLFDVPALQGGACSHATTCLPRSSTTAIWLELEAELWMIPAAFTAFTGNGSLQRCLLQARAN